jgi:AcrR family transcriptional regulator
MADKIDSRVRQTRAALLDALPNLMIERGYERITIQNVLERANVGRATFYAHFDSKDDLLAASVANLRAWLIEAWHKMPDQRLGFTLPLFQHLASHSEIYEKSIARASEVSVERHFRLMLNGLVRDDLAHRRGQPNQGAAVELAVQYVVGALWSITVWWMESGMRLSPLEINALFQRLAFPGLDLTLGEKL